MKKIDAVVIRETKYIAVVTGILSVVLQAVFLVLKKWDYTVLAGNILSSGIGILNFFLIGVTVQKAVLKDEKESKSVMKLSQTYRMFMMLVFISLGVLAPWCNTWAVIIPLFFTRIAIGLQPFLRKESIGGEMGEK